MPPWKGSILLLNLDKHQGTCIYKDIFILWRWYLCGAEEQLERTDTYEEAVESRTRQRKLNFSQNSKLYIVLKLPHNPHGHTSSPMQCFFFIGRGLYSCNACFLLVTTYIHAFVYVSGSTPMHFCFSRSHFVDFISQLHRLGSLPVKAIYYTII